MTNLLDRKDRMSMYSGLEVRVPFCDHQLVEYVWNIPWSMKSRGGARKQVLRDAAKGLLPEDVRNRPKSPYPKTHNPLFEKLARERLLAILDDPRHPHPQPGQREGPAGGDSGQRRGLRPALVRPAHGRPPDDRLAHPAQSLDGALRPQLFWLKSGGKNPGELCKKTD